MIEPANKPARPDSAVKPLRPATLFEMAAIAITEQ